MRLLNLQGVTKLTTKGVNAIADNCPELVSINLGRCELITNKGIERLGMKCLNLQAVNLSGLNKLDERPLCVLTNNNPGLLMLNVTGITEVTVNGLDALIQGMAAVESARSFVGFRPSDNATEKKLQGHLDMLQQNIRNHFQKEKKQERLKREFRERAVLEAQINGSNTIKRYMNGYKLRMGFYRMWQERRRHGGAGEIQRVWRGIVGRVRFNKEMAIW